KPMFRTAFKKHRCLIPASGFYEWTGGKGDKVPHLFTAGDGSPVLAFAGLWDHWTDPESGDDVLSATIIVSGASEWMTPFHDRMPVLLTPDDFDGWLSGELGPEVLKPAAESALREWGVSKRVNRTGDGDEDPTLFDAVESEAA
ncbi:SOS response-associated peptidase, partial [Lichenibacterium minor]